MRHQYAESTVTPEDLRSQIAKFKELELRLARLEELLSTSTKKEKP